MFLGTVFFLYINRSADAVPPPLFLASPGVEASHRRAIPSRLESLLRTRTPQDSNRPGSYPRFRMPASRQPPYDVAIIGGGPAGLTAGIYARLRSLSTILFEAGELGGQLTFLYPTKSVYDYPGLLGVEAEDLGRNFVEHAREAGVKLHAHERVVDVKPVKEGFRIKTAKGQYTARTVVLALGMGVFEYGRLGIPGEAEFEGKGIHHHIKDRRAFKKRRILIVGGGDSALEAAITLAAQAREVTIVHRRDRLRAMEKHLHAVERLPIHVVLNAEVTEFVGDIHLKQAVIYDNQTLDKSILDVDEAVIQVGFAPNLDMLRRWGVKVEHDRRIKVTADMRTSVPGIFACGDIVTYPGKDMRVVTGAGEAVTAVLSAYKYLKKPYWA